MLRFVTLLTLWSTLLTVSGCGRSVSSAPGGTPGNLRTSTTSLSEIQVTVHQAEGTGFRELGFGVTGADGSFQLYKTGASAPLILSPGDYYCTLESAGAPVQIPLIFAQPATTPFKINWTATSQKLDLDVPASAPISVR